MATIYISCTYGKFLFCMTHSSALRKDCHPGVDPTGVVQLMKYQPRQTAGQEEMEYAHPEPNVQIADLLEFAIGETERIAQQICGQPVMIVALGNNSNIALSRPAKKYLGRSWIEI
jgi:hypothetical protein